MEKLSIASNHTFNTLGNPETDAEEWKDHFEGPDCSCKPRVIEIEPVVVHNRFSKEG